MNVFISSLQVYLDGVEFEQVSNPSQCQLVVEEITSHQPHRLSVQCLCSGGFTSPRVELVFEGLVKLEEPASDLDTDLSSVLNSIHYKRGHKRMVSDHVRDDHFKLNSSIFIIIMYNSLL